MSAPTPKPNDWDAFYMQRKRDYDYEYDHPTPTDTTHMVPKETSPWLERVLDRFDAAIGFIVQAFTVTMIVSFIVVMYQVWERHFK